MVFQPIVSIADAIGRVLVALCAIGAAFAFVSAFSVQVAPEAGWLALWQKWGFAMFAGLTSPFIPGAVEAGLIDLVLALILALAYVLTRGWAGWHAR